MRIVHDAMYKDARRVNLIGIKLASFNHNLDFGYAKLDLNAVFRATNHVSLFTQLDNLLGQQHMGPIGYPGLPFTIRAGLKIRIGSN